MLLGQRPYAAALSYSQASPAPTITAIIQVKYYSINLFRVFDIIPYFLRIAKLTNDLAIR